MCRTGVELPKCLQMSQNARRMGVDQTRSQQKLTEADRKQSGKRRMANGGRRMAIGSNRKPHNRNRGGRGWRRTAQNNGGQRRTGSAQRRMVLGWRRTAQNSTERLHPLQRGTEPTQNSQHQLKMAQNKTEQPDHFANFASFAYFARMVEGTQTTCHRQSS